MPRKIDQKTLNKMRKSTQKEPMSALVEDQTLKESEKEVKKWINELLK